MRILFITIAIFITLPLAAQEKSKATSFRMPENFIAGKHYFSSTILIKIKPEYRNRCSESAVDIPILNQELENSKISLIRKKFPRKEKPVMTREMQNQGVRTDQLADLSLIYELKISGDNPNIEKIITRLLKTGTVEYAEPKYIRAPLYNPNDPLAVEASQWQLTNIKAYEAWDITKGDSKITVGILDTGVRLDHEDLANSIQFNLNDPIDGVDNDNDGFIDNYRGWDLADNDNNPGIATSNYPAKGHGTFVAGNSSAEADNGTGVAGVGFLCKFLPLKIFGDAADGSPFAGFEAIVYAADHNCDVINLSWGGPVGFSQFEQDVINYAALQKDVVIVAAAGNTPQDIAFYPASYDHVLSVTNSDKNDMIAIDATFHVNVDVAAPGRKVYSTFSPGQNTYTSSSGTSYSSPQAAGGAALIRAQFPNLNALQTAERLRVTSDDISNLNPDPKYEGTIGKGRINLFRALTEASPAVRLTNKVLINANNGLIYEDDTTDIICTFINYLDPAVNLTVTLSSTSPYVEIIDDVFNVGNLNTLEEAKNDNIPFTFRLLPNAPDEAEILFKLTYTATGYDDFEYFKETGNRGFLTLKTDEIKLTATNRGRWGYYDDVNDKGDGLIYRGQSLLFEGGLMIGLDETKVSDCIRGVPGVRDQDFTVTENIIFTEFTGAESEISTTYVDTENNPDAIKLKISQRSYGRKNSPINKFIISEYEIENIGQSDIETLHIGLFADWDIVNSGNNKADWEPETGTGYVYSIGGEPIYAGVSVLSDISKNYFALDLTDVGGDNIYINDNINGFSPAEKFQSLSNGLARTQAGTGANGNDVAHVTGGTITNLKVGEKQTVTFVITAGDNLEELKSSVKLAAKDYSGQDLCEIVQIYPNPFNDPLNIHFTLPDMQDVTAIVYNSLGQKILEKHVNAVKGNTLPLSLPDQASGMHIIHIFAEGQFCAKKALKIN